jgi:hypothetical protein
MILDILQTFLPWILYFILAGHSPGQMQTAVIVAMAVSLFCEIKSLRKGFILSWVTLIFFVFMFVMIVLYKHAWTMQHASVFSNAALASVSFISILLKKPFTIQYAKERVPKEKWGLPGFIKVNYVLSAAWGCIFVFCMVLNLMHIYWIHGYGWLFEALTDGSVVFGIWFCVWYPDWYRRRALQNQS